MKIHNLINRRITKFCKQTMALTLAALFVVPSIIYSMSNGFSSVKAATPYETVGVDKKLVDCFPGEDRILAEYIYETVLGQGDWDSEVSEDYQLTEEDVTAIQNLDYIYFFVTDDHKSADISGISNLTNLEKFDLDSDEMSFVMEGTDELALLTKLTSLDLCGVDPLPKLPSSLTELDLYNPSPSVFDDIPDSLTSLGIYMDYLNITSLPENLPANLTILSAQYNQLTSLPQLPAGLTNLDISDNQFTSLTLENLANLERLRVDGNQLETVSLKNLPNLISSNKWSDELGLANQNLKSLELSNLPKVTSLSIDSNQLTSFTLENLANLETLNASSNQLESLPELPEGLTSLYVGNNQLKELPALPSSLTKLDANNNQFKELDLSNLANLNTVDVRNQTPHFEYIVTEDGKYKILDVPTKNLSDIEINGEAYNDYDNSGSITVDTLPTSFTYNYNTGYGTTKMNVTATLVELTSISIKNEPAKTLYTAGEKFDPSGLVITLNYGDGSTEDIAYNDSTKDDFTFSPDLNTSLQASHDKVTVTYAEKTAEQGIPIKVFVDTTLTNEGTGVTISGSLEENASLTVSEIDTSHENYSTLLESLGDGKKVLMAVDVSIENGTYKPGDNLILTFDIDPIYNGRTATIKHLLSNGQIETYTATVIDGKIQITVTELSPFMIAIDEDPVTNENNDYNADSDDYYASIYQTGDNAPISALFAIITSSIMVISGYIIINRKKFSQK